MVGVNVPSPVAHHSFGSWRRSQFGDLHIRRPGGVQFSKPSLKQARYVRAAYPAKLGAVFADGYGVALTGW